MKFPAFLLIILILPIAISIKGCYNIVKAKRKAVAAMQVNLHKYIDDEGIVKYYLFDAHWDDVPAWRRNPQSWCDKEWKTQKGAEKFAAKEGFEIIGDIIDDDK